MRRELGLPPRGDIGDAASGFTGAVPWSGLPGDTVAVTLGSTRGDIAAAPLPDGLAVGESANPSGLARWSPGMTDCARVRTVGDWTGLAIVAVAGVVGVVLDVVGVVGVAGDVLDVAIVVDAPFGV